MSKHFGILAIKRKLFALKTALKVKFVFSKKTTKIFEFFTIDLTVRSKCQIDGEDFVKFCGLLKKQEL